jgi:hypothetical protein
MKLLKNVALAAAVAVSVGFVASRGRAEISNIFG